MRGSCNYRTWEIRVLHLTECHPLIALTPFTGKETHTLWGRPRALLDLHSIHSYSGRYSWFNFHQDLRNPSPRDSPRQPD